MKKDFNKLKILLEIHLYFTSYKDKIKIFWEVAALDPPFALFKLCMWPAFVENSQSCA
jgi:hypothetical protein